MFEAALWGTVQGLTEFLPISSSGHLVLVPALLDVEGPDLSTSAVLHLGTLAAVLIYFRSDVWEVLRFTEAGKRLLLLLLIGSVPAFVLAVVFLDQVDAINENPSAVAIAMIVTGIVMIGTHWLPSGHRELENVTRRDAILIGIAQGFALIPGVSRSGSTITGALTRGLGRDPAARFSFLLGIPVIAGGGLKSLLDLNESGDGAGTELFVGVVVAGLVGYLAIAVLLKILRAAGLVPFGIYCVAFGSFAFLVI
jgi:undecaprenyl-diphosphatase